MIPVAALAADDAFVHRCTDAAGLVRYTRGACVAGETISFLDLDQHSTRLERSLGRVRVGMSLDQVEAIDPALLLVPRRSEFVTAAGKTEVRSYPDGQQIVTRAGRVTAIVR